MFRNLVKFLDFHDIQNFQIFKTLCFSRFLDFQTFLSFARAYSLNCFNLFRTFPEFDPIFLVYSATKKGFRGWLCKDSIAKKRRLNSKRTKLELEKAAKKSLHWSFSSFGTERDKFHSIPLSQIQQHYKLQDYTWQQQVVVVLKRTSNDTKKV